MIIKLCDLYEAVDEIRDSIRVAQKLKGDTSMDSLLTIFLDYEIPQNISNAENNVMSCLCPKQKELQHIYDEYHWLIALAIQCRDNLDFLNRIKQNFNEVV